MLRILGCRLEGQKWLHLAIDHTTLGEFFYQELTYLRQEYHKLLELVEHERRQHFSFQAKVAEQQEPLARKVAEQQEQLAQKVAELLTEKVKITELERRLEVETLKRQLAEVRQTSTQGVKREREKGVEPVPLRERRVEPPRKRVVVKRRSSKYSLPGI